VIVRITGPAGTKHFLRVTFCNPESAPDIPAW
jgi:hypothetical protein